MTKHRATWSTVQDAVSGGTATGEITELVTRVRTHPAADCISLLNISDRYYQAPSRPTTRGQLQEAQKAMLLKMLSALDEIEERFV